MSNTAGQKYRFSRENFEIVLFDGDMQGPKQTMFTDITFDEAEKFIDDYRRVFGNQSTHQLAVVPMLSDGCSQFDGCEEVHPDERWGL